MMGHPAAAPGSLAAKSWAGYMAWAAPLCLLCALPPSFAQADRGTPGKISTPVAELRASSIAANPELATALNEWGKAISSADTEAAADQSGKILDRLLAMGSRNMIPAATLAVAVGNRALENFNYDGALMAGQLATQVAPDYPLGYFFLASARFAKDKKDVNNIFPHLINGARATVNNRLELANFITLIIKFVFMSLGLAFMAAFFTQFLFYRQAFYSDVASFVPGGADPKLRPVIGVLAALVPLALGGFFLFTLALPLFVWPYLRKNEKFLVVIFAVFALTAPLAFKQMAKSLILRGDATYRALYLLSMDSWDYEAKLAIETRLAKEPDAPLFLLAAGNQNKMAKNREAAAAAFDKLLAANPSNIKVLVNKGNAFFQDKEYEAAAKIYEQAVKLNPDSAEAYYNLSVAYTEMLQNEKSTKAYENALKLDPKATNAYAAITAQNADRPEKKVIDFLVTADELSLFEQTFQPRVEKLAEGLWGTYFGGFSLDLYRKLSMLYIAAIAGVFLFWERGRIPHQSCLTCGAVFHPPMRLDMTSPKCNQCVAAQSSKSGVAGVKKDVKKKAIREYMRDQVEAAGLLDRILPGIGRVYAHAPFAGLPLTFITSILLVFCGSRFYSDVIAAAVPPADSLRQNAPLLGVMGVYWLIMNTAFHKE
jgi:tetratricopeptide (TPR) repeat protein